MTRRDLPSRRLSLLCALTLTLATGLTACSAEEEDSGVASLGGGSSATAETSTGDTEREVLDYVACLREQGLDVPDPQFDADGNLVLGGGGAAGGPPPDIDPGELEAAQQACGELPEGLTSALDGLDDSAVQDAALEFAQCMRDEGVDVPDPDFSGGAGPGIGGGGPFGDLDLDDPKVSAAFEKCQGSLDGVLGGGTPSAGASS
jgi:hypothetical protein